MKRALLSALMVLGLPLAACTDSNTGEYKFEVFDLSGGDGGSMTMVMPPPPLPFVGQQIDRAGRPGINIFLTNPFGRVTGKSLDQVQDAYNQPNQVGLWTMYAQRPYIAESLAIFDGVDGTCGNQRLAEVAVGATRYLPLATIIADDRLLLDTTKTTCTTYMALELGMTGDCGGRTPIQDVIDDTYTILLGDRNMAAMRVTDGIPIPSIRQSSTSKFPYLCAADNMTAPCDPAK